ncbi:unnamed protein product [Clonostachys rhizophaga]|uniref:LIM zinc-binding domain-containing protein n=1 Tax=Clonostachys rhizophaga TaxID=160324 RepID=A0A9N9VJK9_9HYPO|nr:unnamed protein product [Clonostachys rhizophaga]
MAALGRESVLLPTIKCSQCGAQVEISMMGEHICSPSEPAEKGMPIDMSDSIINLMLTRSQASPLLEKYDTMSRPPDPAPPTKLGRKPLPVNTGIANQLYAPSTTRALDTTPIDSQERPSSSESLELPPSHNDALNSTWGSAKSTPTLGWGFGQKDGFTTEPIPSPGVPSAGFLERMNTIAPGPFDTERRPSLIEFPKTSKDSLSPVSINLERPDSGHGSRSSVSSDEHYDASLPPKSPMKTTYDGFGPPARTEGALTPPPLGNITRSETFPKASKSTDTPARTPSAPGTRNDRLGAQTEAHSRKPSMGPVTSRKPPPRKSLIQPASMNLASVDLAAEFGISNPYHTPSDSTSSGYSGFSQPSYASSRTSSAGYQAQGQASSDSNIDKLIGDVQMSMDSMQTKGLEVDTKAAPRSPSPISKSPRSLSPLDGPSPSSQNYRHDDASQGFSNHLMTPPIPTPIPAARSNTHPQLSPQGSYFPPESPRFGTSPEQPLASPRSRGNCKACNLAITGKSISSADGRLTGKYHKACFVCASCSEPFTSAEFYVLNDKPYCERHYHTLNGSLCATCDRGIEGHYIEDEVSTKYHIGCFCCHDCGRSLSDGYFEVGGKQYCEQDALNRNRSQPPQPRNFGGRPPLNHNPYSQPSRHGPSPLGSPNEAPQPQQRPGFAAYGAAYTAYSPRGTGPSSSRPGYGPPTAMRSGPGMGLSPNAYGQGPPIMNKRSTRLGLMS